MNIAEKITEDLLCFHRKGLIDLSEFGVSYMLGLGYRNEPITPKKRQALDEILEVID